MVGWSANTSLMNLNANHLNYLPNDRDGQSCQKNTTQLHATYEKVTRKSLQCHWLGMLKWKGGKNNTLRIVISKNCVTWPNGIQIGRGVVTKAQHGGS